MENSEEAVDEFRQEYDAMYQEILNHSLVMQKSFLDPTSTDLFVQENIQFIKIELSAHTNTQQIESFENVVEALCRVCKNL